MALHTVPRDASLDLERERTFDLFRRWGYLEADLDPLGLFRPLRVPELAIDSTAADEARAIYCGTIGAEFMHIPDAERRQWVQQQIESPAPAVDQHAVLEGLMRAEIFEEVLQTRYLGTKRYSLEGVAALIPCLWEVIETASQSGGEEVVLAMSHRGRLTVITLIARRTPLEIFTGFEDVDPRSVLGGGDVKYHLGATGVYETRSGGKVRIHLVSNPSHLEAVDPVAVGRVRAKQTRLGPGSEKKVVAVMLHGDAAFAGQGITAETMNFANVRGYDVGGTVHIIVNNLIGFTTSWNEAHSSRFSADLARRLPIPIFHVNAEDPEAVARVARMAAEYRYRFGSDVVIDLVGYRRHGHSEVDDPTITQPLLYRAIKQHPLAWQTYAEDLGMAGDAARRAEEIRREFGEAQKQASQQTKMPVFRKLPSYWDRFGGGPYSKSSEVETAASDEEVRAVTAALTTVPDGFHIHPKVKRLLEERARMGAGERQVDYGMAEALAFGTLLRQGVPVRLAGQDSRRGTFNQRHSVWIDTENEDEYIALQHVAGEQAWFEVWNSTLSEAGAMGFEYGFSRDYPEALVCWEAQFGDFANGAQIIIDQFVAASEDKWNLLSGLVLLLPHGYEGQGPEHSSARMERFLQLCGEDNMQVAQPSTSAQYFHLLRRQALRAWRKPLIVFTPKGMLRHPDASSPITEFIERKNFQTVIADHEVHAAQRVLVCTGKIGHELRRERKRAGDSNAAIVMLEQLYPFPAEDLEAAIEQHPQAREIIWVQEEPANMGALFFVKPRLRRLARGRQVRSIKRSASASPSTGSAKGHEIEQRTLLSLAFPERAR